MLYESISLKQEISIQRMYTIHCYEYDGGFAFAGESHPFWELVYVDLGEASVVSGQESYLLPRGKALLHAPDVFHSLKATGGEALTLLVLSFECDSEALSSICRRTLEISGAEKHLLSSIIADAREAFESPLNGTYFKLRRRLNASYGTEQVIRLNLEMLLLLLLRRNREADEAFPPEAMHRQNDNEALAKSTLQLMENNLRHPLSLERLCHEMGVSQDKLQRVFRGILGESVMEHYSTLRIEKSKALIRDAGLNFTQIAELLGFSSIHYFSKQFKQFTGMSPSEYSRSVRSLSEKKSC